MSRARSARAAACDQRHHLRPRTAGDQGDGPADGTDGGEQRGDVVEHGGVGIGAGARGERRNAVAQAGRPHVVARVVSNRCASSVRPSERFAHSVISASAFGCRSFARRRPKAHELVRPEFHRRAVLPAKTGTGWPSPTKAPCDASAIQFGKLIEAARPKLNTSPRRSSSSRTDAAEHDGLNDLLQQRGVGGAGRRDRALEDQRCAIIEEKIALDDAMLVAIGREACAGRCDQRARERAARALRERGGIGAKRDGLLSCAHDAQMLAQLSARR